MAVLGQGQMMVVGPGLVLQYVSNLTAYQSHVGSFKKNPTVWSTQRDPGLMGLVGTQISLPLTNPSGDSKVESHALGSLTLGTLMVDESINVVLYKNAFNYVN